MAGEFDSNPDSLLNDVPVPAGLLPRLCDIAALSDDELDVRLRDVAVPGGLAERLTFLVAAEELDEQLRDLAIPVSVLARTRIIPLRRQRSPLRDWALALSLLLLVGAGILTLVGGMVASARWVEPPPLALVVIDDGPLDLVFPMESAVAIVPDDSEAPPQLAETGLSDETMAMFTTFDRPQPGPAGQLAADLHTAWNPWDNWLLKRWGVLGFAPVGIATLPELASFTAPIAQGMESPLVRGYDREFLYAYAVQPPMLTSFDPAARSLEVPLTTRTTSFDEVRRLASAGRMPTPEQIRVEDFLAAVSSRQLVQAEPGTLAVSAVAGPSVFNPSAAGLLQVGVQAGMHRRRSLPATHLVLAIDASVSMAWDGSLDTVRRGVADALRYLTPQDRLSMIVFADDVAEIVREVRGDDRAELDHAMQLLEIVPAEGGANLGLAVQQAISLAIESESASRLPRRLILVTANQPLLTGKEAEGLRQMLTEAAKSDFRFDICDLVPDGETAEEAWQALAGPVGCTVRRPPSADALCWALVETLTGDSSLAATEVKMRVEFNPKAVAAYRLIGHESTTVGGLLPAGTEADLHVGQGSSALFEIWLYPNEEDDVATVRTQWNEPGGGKSRQLSPQRVSRLQFATALEGAALSLQSAAIAAEGAEVLKQAFNFSLVSPDRYRYAPKPSGLGHVLTQADRTAAALAKEQEFRRLVEVLEALSGLVGERGTAAARHGARGINADQWREYGSK